MSKERIGYLDVLKTIAIFLVCSYHFSWVSNCSYSIADMNVFTLERNNIFNFRC